MKFHWRVVLQVVILFWLTSVIKLTPSTPVALTHIYRYGQGQCRFISKPGPPDLKTTGCKWSRWDLSWTGLSRLFVYLAAFKAQLDDPDMNGCTLTKKNTLSCRITSWKGTQTTVTSESISPSDTIRTTWYLQVWRIRRWNCKGQQHLHSVYWPLGKWWGELMIYM